MTSATGSARRETWIRRLPVLPAIVFTVALTQLPFVIALIFSTIRWSLTLPGTERFVGIDNYVRTITDDIFHTALINTILLTVSVVLLSALVGLVVALMLDRKFRGRGLARTLTITAFLVMPAAASMVWKTQFFNATYGLINIVLTPFGGANFDWLAQAPMVALIIIMVWQWMPFMMLILLAGLQSQSTEILEAAKVDGANARNTFRYLTLPHLRQYIELGIVLGSIYISQAVDQVFLVTLGGPGNETTTIPYYVYLKTFREGEIGLASAAGIIAVVVTFALASFALRRLSSLFRTGSAYA